MAAQPFERGLVIFLQKLCFGFLISKISHAWETSPAHPPTAIEDKLCRCCVRLRALYLALGLKPIIQLVTVCPSALLVKFVGAFLNLLLNRDRYGRFARIRCEGLWLFLDLLWTAIYLFFLLLSLPL
jgi:hypothetical protein